MSEENTDNSENNSSSSNNSVDLNSPMVRDFVNLQLEKQKSDLTTEFTTTNQALEDKKNQLLDEKKKLAQKYSNVDLDKYTALIEKEQEIEAQREIDKGNYDLLKKAKDEETLTNNAAHAKQLADIDASNKELLEAMQVDTQKQLADKDKALVQYMVKGEVSNSMIAEGVEQPDMLWTLLQSKFEGVNLDTGDLGIKVQGFEGPVTDYIKSLKEDSQYGIFFKPSGASGGSAQGNDDNTNSGESSSSADLKRSEMNSEQKAKYIGANSMSDYFKLPA